MKTLDLNTHNLQKKDYKNVRAEHIQIALVSNIYLKHSDQLFTENLHIMSRRVKNELNDRM